MVSVSGSVSPKPNSISVALQPPLAALWSFSDVIDPHPPAQPGFKCRCKKCIQTLALSPVTPTSDPEKLKMFRSCEKVYLNPEDKDSYMKIYSNGDSPVNVILKLEHLKKNTDSSIIFVDPCGSIILHSHREAMATTVKFNEMTLGLVRGSPGGCFSFRRTFCIIIQPNTLSERKLVLKARGPMAKFCICSPCNSFYLDEFVVFDADKTEVGWIRGGGGKRGLTCVEYSPMIMDDDKAKGLILAAAVTLFELFIEPHGYGWNVGSVGIFYILLFGFPTTILVLLYFIYYFELASV